MSFEMRLSNPFENQGDIRNKEKELIPEPDESILRRGIEKLWKVLESKEAESLPSTIILPDTTARSLLPILKPVIDRIYTGKGIKTPFYEFVITASASCPNKESKEEVILAKAISAEEDKSLDGLPFDEKLGLWILKTEDSAAMDSPEVGHIPNLSDRQLNELIEEFKKLHDQINRINDLRKKVQSLEKTCDDLTSEFDKKYQAMISFPQMAAQADAINQLEAEIETDRKNGSFLNAEVMALHQKQYQSMSAEESKVLHALISGASGKLRTINKSLEEKTKKLKQMHNTFYDLLCKIDPEYKKVDELFGQKQDELESLQNELNTMEDAGFDLKLQELRKKFGIETNKFRQKIKSARSGLNESTLRIKEILSRAGENPKVMIIDDYFHSGSTLKYLKKVIQKFSEDGGIGRVSMESFVFYYS